MTSHKDREEARAAFLKEAGWDTATRAPIAGDASTRTYVRLDRNGMSAILMDWPPGADAAPPPGQKPYSQVAHLAEDCRPFIAVGTYLRNLNLSAPEIYAQDADRGFLLLEDLGAEVLGPIIDQGKASDGTSLEEIYHLAIDVILTVQANGAPAALPVGDGTSHNVPAFDDSVYRAEIDMIPDWYFPVVRERELGVEERAGYHALWTGLRPVIDAGPQTLFLRDFHSPNILWLSDRQGPARIGLIDYQDALIGSRAYDIVSLLQDARRDVPRARESALLAYYVTRASATLQGFDEQEFRASYAVLGAERALRLIGLWPRLLKRDNKPHYMAHMPRTIDYLDRNLAHPALGALAGWLKAQAGLGNS